VTRVRKALLHTSLLLLALVIATFLYLDRIVGAAVERGGGEALGVETDVGGVQIALLRGHVGITRLEIANPQGFSSDPFLRLGRIRVHVPPQALLGDPVVIPSIVLEDLELKVEGSAAGTNYGRILGHASAQGGGGEASAGSPGKKFVVKELVVRNIRANVTVGMGSRVAGTVLEVPEIRLQDLGTSSSGGVDLAALIGQVTSGVLQNVVRKQPQLAGLVGRELGGLIGAGAQKARENLERLGGSLLKRDP
jgi:hypothetical protein